MKVLPKKVGICVGRYSLRLPSHASMKAPPKRKGNYRPGSDQRQRPGLNESPSEKEGKSVDACQTADTREPSMKAPPKRKGNALLFLAYLEYQFPQ